MHQASKVEGKNSLREPRDVLVLIMILNDFSLLYLLNFTPWCAILFQIILYSV